MTNFNFNNSIQNFLSTVTSSTVTAGGPTADSEEDYHSDPFLRFLKGGAKGGGGASGAFLLVFGVICSFFALFIYRHQIIHTGSEFIATVFGIGPGPNGGSNSKSNNRSSSPNDSEGSGKNTTGSGSSTASRAQMARLAAIKMAETEAKQNKRNGIGGPSYSASVKPLDDDYGYGRSGNYAIDNSAKGDDDSFNHDDVFASVNSQLDGMRIKPAHTQKGYDKFGGRGFRPPLFDQWVDRAKNDNELVCAPPPSPPKRTKNIVN